MLKDLFIKWYTEKFGHEPDFEKCDPYEHDAKDLFEAFCAGYNLTLQQF